MARLALDSLEGLPELLQSEREGLGRAGGISKTRAGWGGGSWWCAVKKKTARGGEGLGGKEEAASSCGMIGGVVEEWREGRRGWRRARRAGAGWGGGHRHG